MKMKKIGGGLFVDEALVLHIVLADVLEAAGFADTLENQAMLEAALHELAKARGVSIAIVPENIQKERKP